MTTRNTKSIDDFVLILIIVISFSPILIYLFSDRFQGSVPPALIAFMVSAGISTLVYRFLGGISQDTSFSTGAVKVGGSLAALLASWYLINGALVEQAKDVTNRLQAENLAMQNTLAEQKIEIESKNQEIVTQAGKIEELENKLEEMNEDIAMNPSAAMSFLPYALRTIGAGDGTIDCATSQSTALKDLACQQIQTLLNSVDSSYELGTERRQIRSEVMRYQRENNLIPGQSERKAGMLDERTLRALMQDRLEIVGSEKTPDDYFP